MKITQEQVDKCLNIAVYGNDYKKILSWETVQVCVDLVAFEKQFEGVEVELLLPFVENWMERQATV